MAVFQALIDITGKADNYEDSKELLIKKLNSFLMDFKKEELCLTKSQAKIKDFDEVILLRDFATDLWNEILMPELREKKSNPCNSVIQGLLNRFLIQVRETLFLLAHNMGLSAISNVRLFMESYAITKYIIDKGDAEAQRFMDYYHYQYCLATKTELKPDFIEKYGERTKSNHFYSIPYGWCSDEKVTGEKLISKVGSAELLDNYHLTCNYIHASPYSTYHVVVADDPTSPISSLFLIDCIRKVTFDLLHLLLEYYFDEKKRKPYMILLSMLVPDLNSIKTEVLQNV